MNYYNENDIFCANWLYNLIQAKLIPPGDIDTRDIRDVKPTDLNNYKQCHFFAGIGGWPLALALAGVGSDEPLWTGSCPCQPFSAAGRRGGFSDERHLWPSFHYLIAQCGPPTIFGEQVASAADWLRLVRGDLEAMDYAVGCCPVEAASAGADHLRDRFWFVADDGSGRCVGSREGESELARRAEVERASNLDVANNNNNTGPQGWTPVFERPDQRVARANGVAHPDFPQRRQRDQQPAGQLAQQQQHSEARLGDGYIAKGEQVGSTGQSWERDGVAWVIGADGKARRVKSGVRLLVDGFPSRVGLLRGFGNAIDPRPAAAFIKASRQ